MFDEIYTGPYYGARATPPAQEVSDEVYILNKSRDHTRAYCPTCEPDTNPLTELVTMCYCSAHCPADSGVDDLHPAVPSQPAVPGDVGGDSNRLFCNFFHRGVLPNAEGL